MPIRWIGAREQGLHIPDGARKQNNPYLGKCVLVHTCFENPKYRPFSADREAGRRSATEVSKLELSAYHRQTKVSRNSLPTCIVQGSGTLLNLRRPG